MKATYQLSCCAHCAAMRRVANCAPSAMATRQPRPLVFRPPPAIPRVGTQLAAARGRSKKARMYN
eukprot:6197222-Pleurochrysis_carterae.AAC.2